MTMDVTFFENQPYFTKNHLQGESIERKDPFWEVMEPLPMSLSCHPQKSHLEVLLIEPLSIVQPLPNGPNIIDSNSLA